MKRFLFWAIAGIAILAAVLWGPIMSRVEQAKYTVVETLDNIEIRDYAPMIIAEVDVSGPREEAINKGFRMIADYIFGNNISSEKVAMTAPVTQQPGENIAMTAPVMQQPGENIAMTAPVTQQGEGDSWKIRFVMPAAYTMESLPKPKNNAVTLKSIEGKRFAVIQFSGFARENSLRQRTEELNNFIGSKKLNPLSKPVYAFYNPPWTLPFLRRNEVMVEVAK